MNTITFGQLLLAVSIPTVVALLGIIWNNVILSSVRSELITLRTEMVTEFGKMRAEMSVMAGDLRQFYHLTGKLEGRVDTIEKR